MNDQEQPTTALATTGPSEIEVSATNPQEMVGAQQSLIGWCERKIEQLTKDANELLEAYKQAVKAKWKSSTLKRHADLADKRIVFFQKMKAALEAGYTIVPNFPITLFAIRTDKESVTPMTYVGGYKYGADFQQDPQVLPAGEGTYKNPFPLIKTDKRKTAEGKDEFTIWASNWQEEIEFPLAMAKPKIMAATNRAMALKIFDQFGVLFPQAAKADPLICAEILDPRPTGYGVQKRVTFIIGWHLNTRDL